MAEGSDAAQVLTKSLENHERNVQPRACLDGLPGEIRSLILLSLDDTSSLRSLVRSSPLYHGSYLSQRQLILSRVLARDLLPECTFLACALEQVSIIPRLQQEGEDLHVLRAQFIGHFWKQIGESRPEDQLSSIDFDTLLSIFRRHWLIKSITSQYSKDNLPSDVGDPINELSSEERLRLYRSLYHFEIYCSLFVSRQLSYESPSNEPYLEEPVRLTVAEYGMSQRYLPNLEVADVEGMACLRQYFFMYYDKLLASDCGLVLQQLRNSPPEWMPLLEGTYSNPSFVLISRFSSA